MPTTNDGETPPEVVNRLHDKADKDVSANALHHTLGARKNQASPGDHLHDGTTSLVLTTGASSFSGTPQNTITVETVIASVSFNFVAGKVYRVFYSCRPFMTGGTSPYAPFVKIRRVNAAGTTIYDPGATAIIGANSASINGTVYLKCSADTTQTIVLTITKNTTGTPTSVSVNADPTAPTALVIEDAGLNTNYTGALEVPTS